MAVGICDNKLSLCFVTVVSVTVERTLVPVSR
jgi:hypothetical protein